MKNAKIFGFSLCILLFAAVTKSPVANAHDAPFDQKTLPYGTTWWCDPGDAAVCHRLVATCDLYRMRGSGNCKSQDAAYTFSLVAPDLIGRKTPMAVVLRTEDKCREFRKTMLGEGAASASACEQVGTKPPPKRPPLPLSKKYWCFSSVDHASPSMCSTTLQRCKAAQALMEPLTEVTFECGARTRVWASYSRVDGDVPAFAIAMSKEDCETHRDYFGLDGERCIQLGRKKGPDDPYPDMETSFANMLSGKHVAEFPQLAPISRPPPLRSVSQASPAPSAVPPLVQLSALEFEQLRVGGNMAIVPSPNVALLIARKGMGKLVAKFSICTQATGAVGGVGVELSSGVPEYDLEIATAVLATWRYKPYIVDGSPATVCSEATVGYLPK